MSRRFLLVYASQTGQAKAIAEELLEKAENVGLQADLHCISSTEKKFWLEREKLAVIISSTTGDGDPPDTATKFVRRLKKKTLPKNHLAQLRYAFLGLGDSNYTNFCNCGKMLDKRLSELGAQRFLPASWADDATGLEQVVEPWLESVIPALCKELRAEGTMTLPEVTESSVITIDMSSIGLKEDSSGDFIKDKSQKGNQDQKNLDKQRLIEEVAISEPPVKINTTSDGSKDDVDSVVESDGQKGQSNAEMANEMGKQGVRISDPILSKESNTASGKDEEMQENNESGKIKENSGSSKEISDSHTDMSQNDSKISDNDIQKDVLDKVNIGESELLVNGQKGDMGFSDKLNITDSSTNCDVASPVNKASTKRVNGNRDSSEENADSQLEQNDHTGSLTKSIPPLSEVNLSVPVCPVSYIGIAFQSEKSVGDVANLNQQNGAPFPSAQSALSEVPILRATRMTSDDALKTALKLQLDIQETGWDYIPGDSVGILCENTDQEVQDLIDRLGLSNVADTVCDLSVLPDTKKKNAKVPGHYPSPSTLRLVLRYCCDIRAPPKKALLRAFVECCEDSGEKRRLQELCSKQGSEDYTQSVRNPGLSLLDVLLAFPSVKPRPATILEHCPRLLPRPYSAASSPLKMPGRMEIVFNVVEIPSGVGRAFDRQGICTGMLNSMCQDLLTQSNKHIDNGTVDSCQDSTKGNHSTEMETDTKKSLCKKMDGLSIRENLPKIQVYLRSNQHFRPPEDLSTSCILIGPGTGVAPFVGFLQHRAAKLEQNGSEKKPGEMWLFFGCRHKERDFLFREELESFAKSGVLTNLQVSFSRDQTPSLPSQPRYVQDNIKLQGENIARLICNDMARVYVCGDAKGMARNVNQTFVEVLQEHRGMTEKESAAFIMDMRINRRYLEDVWT